MYELFAAGAYDAAAEMVDPNLEWDTSAAPTGVRVTGSEAAVRDYGAMLEVWEDYESVPERFVESGDHVLVVVRNRGRGAGGGVPIEARRAHLWRLRDCVPVAMRLYLDPDEAFEALER
jgi:ketosteroid isomerase-like protein